VLGLAVGLVSVGLGVWLSPGKSAAGVILAVQVVYSATGVILALPGVIAVAGGMTAFRADLCGRHARPSAGQPDVLAAGPCSSVGRDRG
jgi:hypothetical protein